ncbi:MAG: ABC transporter substrate-binding protein [Streptosporangiales bacterium]|nr:ABC transporter substrate-binding protein [Streptosporangiales bacterium]
MGNGAFGHERTGLPAGQVAGRGLVGRRQLLRTVTTGAALAAAAPVVAACGGGDSSEQERIRFAFAPDPCWDFLKRRNVIAKFEQKYGISIETSSTWDEFAYFAGGHGEIVSTATYELPVLEERTGIETVTFGKYNLLRITPVTRSGSGYETLADIPKGSKIGVPSAVSSTLVWAMFAKKLHDLDFRTGGGDFKLVVEDHFVMAEHVERGELEAALVIPEAAIGLLRKKKLEVMYGGKFPWQIYGGICECQHRGVMGNNFTARAKWFDNHRREAAAFLAIWEEGVRLWRKNQAEIIRTFPQHFSVEGDADVKAMQEYMKEHDWFVDSVYLDESWIEREKGLYSSMKETGFMKKNTPTPRFEVVKPREAEQ